jgi:hypothetical protein
MGSISQYLPIINVLGFIALGTAIFYTQFKSGAKQVSSEVITNYKALDDQKTQQIEALKQDVEEIRANMRSSEKGFIERIAKLEGQLKEKDNQLKMVHQILANRNPELEQVLGEIRDFMQSIDLQNQHQTKILERGQIRDENIDQSTEEETGNVLRKQ